MGKNAKHKDAPYDTLSTGQIRLITIQRSQHFNDNVVCYMRPRDLDDDDDDKPKLDHIPPYKALSYTWGDPNVTDTLTLNGVEVPKTTNLISALKRLRERKDVRDLWIDALSIDQSDLNEKNIQVGLMGKIYSRAEEVLIWLGEASEDSDLALAYLGHWSRPSSQYKEDLRFLTWRTSRQTQTDNWTAFELSERDSTPKNMIKDSLGHKNDLFRGHSLQALARLFQRPYWRRTWVIQEVSCKASLNPLRGFRAAVVQSR